MYNWKRKESYNRVFFVVITIAIITSLSVTWRRIQAESQNKIVTCAVPYQDIQKIALLGGSNIEPLLNRIKNEKIIQTISINEETLSDYINEGRVTLLRGSEIINLNRVGQVNRFVLNHIYGRRKKPKPDHYYLIIDKNEDYEKIRNSLRNELGKSSIIESKWNILEVIAEKEDLFNIGLGFSKKKINMLEGLGFKIIVRLMNSNRLNNEIIKDKLQEVKSYATINTIIFEGESVLGYPDHIDTMKKRLFKNKYRVGMIEFENQIGFKQLVIDNPKNVIRVHSIPQEVMDRITYERALNRNIRAVKERSIRLLYLHPFLNLYNQQSIINYNLQYFKDIHSQLKQYGYRLNTASSETMNRYQPIQAWELGVISLGILSAVLFLWGLLIEWNIVRLISVYSLFFISYYICMSVGKINQWSLLMSIIVAIVGPLLALITQFPAEDPYKKSKKKIFQTYSYGLRLLGITLAASVSIVALLSDYTYLVGLQQFLGVRFVFLVPLLLIGIYFFLRPHRITSMLFVFKRLIYAPIKTSSLLAVAISVVFILIYLLRNGNYIVLQLPNLEERLRGFLENLLYIRPRTKEFLIGYPLLLLTYYYVDIKISRNWVWFFNMLGSVALLSVVNTFCHLHTPIMISLYRTCLGLFIGLIIATTIILAEKAYHYLRKGLSFKFLSKRT